AGADENILGMVGNADDLVRHQLSDGDDCIHTPSPDERGARAPPLCAPRADSYALPLAIRGGGAGRPALDLEEPASRGCRDYVERGGAPPWGTHGAGRGVGGRSLHIEPRLHLVDAARSGSARALHSGLRVLEPSLAGTRAAPRESLSDPRGGHAAPGAAPGP